jgi:hypothetical protein
MMNMMKTLISVAVLAEVTVAFGQPAPIGPQPSRYSYADLADFALSGPIIAELRIRKAEKLASAAENAAASKQRYLITADVTSVIRAVNSIPPRVEFLYDAPRDAEGRLPKLTKAVATIAALPVNGKPQALRLASPDALIFSGPNEAAAIRAIVTAALDPAAPPEISGVGSAFHTPGTLEGEGDTQIFLMTRDGRPISFNVIRTPAAAPRWSVSIDELVDASGAQPRRDTLLWYRLACFLPQTLPPASTASNPEQAAIVTEDYATIVRGLGPCRRTRR